MPKFYTTKIDDFRISHYYLPVLFLLNQKRKWYMFETRATVWSFQLVTSFLCYSIIENRTTAPTVIKLLPKPDKITSQSSFNSRLCGLQSTLFWSSFWSSFREETLKKCVKCMLGFISNSPAKIWRALRSIYVCAKYVCLRSFSTYVCGGWVEKECR